MTLRDLLDRKRRLTSLTSDDVFTVEKPPLWRPRPGHGQTWRHRCLLCDHIFADDTYVPTPDPETWKRYVSEHYFTVHL